MLAASPLGLPVVMYGSTFPVGGLAAGGEVLAVAGPVPVVLFHVDEVVVAVVFGFGLDMEGERPAMLNA